MNIQRNLLAALLIFLVFLLTPQYLRLIGLDQDSQEDDSVDVVDVLQEVVSSNKEIAVLESSSSSDASIKEITIINQLYQITLSSQGGGSVVEYKLTSQNDSGEYEYVGTYDESGLYSNNAVTLSHKFMNNACSPCLSINNGVHRFTENFGVQNYDDGDTLYVGGGETLRLVFEHTMEGGDYIKKSMDFYSDSYHINSEFTYNLQNSFPKDNIEIIWDSGVAPTELNTYDEATYSGAYVYQIDDIDYIVQSGEAEILSTKYDAPTDWMAIRNKFFVVAIVPEIKADYAILGSKNLVLNTVSDSNDLKSFPVYESSLGFRGNFGSLAFSQYVGPLDVDRLSGLHESLDLIMNFGWSIIAPFSKAILWFVKLLHNTLKINYGVVLIFVALIMRVVTGPLTKKAYESSAKMRVTAPLQKEIQEKYKDNPQKLQEEMGKLWKEHGFNPISGCLPMLLQWPILMSFFIVFRSTIEFRGEPFVLWISDLSQPDYILSLPFHVPLYGSGVAVLPILMGISMFLTMRITAPSNDNSQKTMMYFMNGFFVLIFNQFPSGLTLYYTIYNFLAYQQQLSLKNKD